MTDLQTDLQERWLPSPEQMTLANALLAAGYTAERGERRERGVYTIHLLMNKSYGWWTEDVQVVPLDGVFLTRNAAIYAVHDAARRTHDLDPNQKVIGGWAWHSKVDHAAVWEDICSVFPRMTDDIIPDSERIS